MPESKSVYDIYRGAGVSAGEYQASLYETEDVWGKIESSRERSAFKQEQTGRTIDTLMSAVELGSQLYGGYKAKQEFEGDLGTLKEDMGDYEKVGKDDKLWSKMSRWEKMWDEPKYKFGEKTYGKEDITVLAQMKRYGIDIKPSTATGGVTEDKSMIEEATYEPTFDVQDAGGKDFSYEDVPDKYKLSSSEWIVPEIKGAGHGHPSLESFKEQSKAVAAQGTFDDPFDRNKALEELDLNHPDLLMTGDEQSGKPRLSQEVSDEYWFKGGGGRWR